jgi:hypothetical protein
MLIIRLYWSHWLVGIDVTAGKERMMRMTAQMATETSASSGRGRWYPRWAGRALVSVVALAALAALAVEVVWPLSAGLPVGWGQYQNSAYHLRVGTPAFWNVVADNSLGQGLPTNCTLALAASPLGVGALRTTLDTAKAPRWLGVFVAGPCDASAFSDPQASLPTGQRVSIAGVSAPIEVGAVGGAAQVSYVASVTLHGYTYTFTLHDVSDPQAQQDMPDFLTFARSFRYVS